MTERPRELSEAVLGDIVHQKGEAGDKFLSASCPPGRGLRQGCRQRCVCSIPLCISSCLSGG